MLKQFMLAISASFGLAEAATAQVQQSRSTLLGDAARFNGAAWEVRPIVRLDSSKSSDTMSVRQLGGVARLAANRYAYTGLLTNGKKWALFAVTNGVTTRLAVEDREFMVGGQKAKYWVGPGIFTLGGKATALVAIGQRLPNAIWTTDGTAWKPFLQKGDALRVGNETLIVEAFSGSTIDSTGARWLTILSKTPKFHGIVRLADGGAERVLAEGDSMPGVPSVNLMGVGILGLTHGLRSLEPTRNGWVAVVRNDLGSRRYVDLVIARDSTRTMKLLAQSDTFGVRNGKDSIGTGVFASPSGDVLLQRGGTVGIATATGEWKPLVNADQLQHSDGHALTEAAWMDERSHRVLFAVTLTKTHVSSQMSGVSVSRMWSMRPVLFFHDGQQTTRVRPDSAFQANAFINLPPIRTILHVAGYQDAIVEHGLGIANAATSVFEPGSAAFTPAPTFRTSEGEMPVRSIIAWEGPNEALVHTRWGLALLRRRDAM